jgi:hypothetical protein
MSGMTKDEIVDVTGYRADLVLRICTDAARARAPEPRAGGLADRGWLAHLAGIGHR